MAEKNEIHIGDCEQRVAYDLMVLVKDFEATVRENDVSTNPRKYFLTLYPECLDAVRGARYVSQP